MADGRVSVGRRTGRGARLRLAALVLLGSVAGALLACTSGKKLPPPRGTPLSGSGGNGGSGGAAGGGGAVCNPMLPGTGGNSQVSLCAAAASLMTKADCALCVQKVTAPCQPCSEPTIACHGDAACGQVIRCTAACSGKADCIAGCIVPIGKDAGRKEYADVMACVALECGAQCFSATPPTCVLGLGGMGGGGGAGGGGKGTGGKAAGGSGGGGGKGAGGGGGAGGAHGVGGGTGGGGAGHGPGGAAGGGGGH